MWNCALNAKRTLALLSVILALIVLYGRFVLWRPIVTSKMASVVELWPEVKDDLTGVTWAHAVNSVSQLNSAMASDSIMMLEADVNLGASETPIMAHPPDTTSDLTLQQFIHTIAKAPKKKGFKLDFKRLEIVEASLKMIEADFANPFWLNADILHGPSSNEQKAPINANEFIRVCKKYFPLATLSLGWSTGLTDSYEAKHIEKMIDVIENHSLQGSSLTFAVRACLLRSETSHELLWKLLELAGSDSSSLTVWTAPNDPADVDALALLIKKVGKNRVYLDLPHDLKTKVDKNI